MTTEEIITLGRLSRIALSTSEVETFKQDIDAILDYVGIVKDLVSDVALAPTVGARYNVLRPDIVTNEPGSYTESIIKAMPHTKGQYLAVKKILQQSE